jgi:hypothetical protein
MAHDARKAELIAALDRARSSIAVNAGALREDLDPLARVKGSFRRHGFAWMSGAALFGLVLAKLPARKKIVTVDSKGQKLRDAPKAATAGIILGVLKIAFDLGKPWLAEWVARRATGFAEQRVAGGTAPCGR